jgi:hypothetical protein
VSINSVPTLVLASSTTPIMATAIFYALICIKMNHSKRMLDSLEVAAFNKQRREVGFLELYMSFFLSFFLSFFFLSYCPDNNTIFSIDVFFVYRKNLPE